MTYQRLQTVEVMEMDGETIILNQETFAVTRLNETGGWIWDQLSEGLTADQIEERMSVEFTGADRERIHEDLSQFLSRMSEIGLIHRAG